MANVQDLGGQSKPIELMMSENYAAAVKRGLATHREYYHEFTIALLDGSEATWDLCFGTIPTEIDRRDYLRYLEDEIVAKNFQPHPGAQVFHDSTEEQIHELKRELKPQYMAIVAFAKKWLTQ